MLAVMARHVPRTLEAMLLHALPPAAAELLTQILEQADASAAETGTASAREIAPSSNDLSQVQKTALG